MRFLLGIGSLLVLSFGAKSVWSLTSTSDTRAPFVISLENEGGQFCSGSIVTNSWVLTAASCVWDKPAMEISVGIQPLDVHSGSYHRRALKMYVHPDYVPHASGANIALIKLKRPIEWNGRSIFMRLANDSAELQKMSDCLMVGWDRGDRAPNHLKPINLPSENCLDKISQSLCLNETDDQLCKFREGSPLLCVRQEKYLQVGFLSGIKNCDTDNTSYVVSSVVHFHEWMMNVIQHKNLIQDLQSEKGYLRRLSRFNWLILAVLVFVASVVILIQVLRSRFRIM